jgi:hypothetical protein
VGEGRRTSQVIDCDEFDILIVDCRPQNVAPDAAETVDSNLDWHGYDSSTKKSRL